MTTVRRITAPNPALAVGEAYMDGGHRAGRIARIYDVLDAADDPPWQSPKRSSHRFATRFKGCRAAIDRVADPARLAQFNPASRSQRNVAHHYDLNGRLYSLFLDGDRQYSCAYFPTGDETLEEAQVAKKRHIAAKLLLDRPDLHVLDIGCGWGGMGLTLARDYGARVTGITLSAEQLESERRGARAGRRIVRPGARSSCLITAAWRRRRSTGSSRSACSSMSASGITGRSSMW